MNSLRYLYIVPAYIFLFGLLVGWVSMLCVPFIYRWIERKAEDTNKRLAVLRSEREALLTNFIASITYQDYTDVNKRAN